MAICSAKELFILGRVSLRPTHGHEIMRTLRESHADLWIELSEKHVYYILRKFDRDGLVTSVEQRTGRLPARHVFSITPAGRAALAGMMADEGLVRAVPYSEFDVVLGMLSYTDALDDRAKDAVLAMRRNVLETRMAKLSADAASADGTRGFPRIILERVTMRISDELTWLDSIIALVERDGWDAMEPVFDASPPGS
jgi:DNA-binding PadR family transcriptional regulator